MSDRMPNEILITPDVLQQMLSEGGSRVLSVKNGPAPEAQIIGVEWRYVNGVPLIVLVYSSDVPEPVLRHEHGLERRLAEKDLYIEQLEYGLAKANHDNCGCLGYVGPRDEDGSPA